MEPLADRKMPEEQPRTVSVSEGRNSQEVFTCFGVAHVHVGEHVYNITKNAFVQFGVGVVFWKDAFEAFVVGFYGNHGFV